MIQTRFVLNEFRFFVRPCLKRRRSYYGAPGRRAVLVGDARGRLLRIRRRRNIGGVVIYSEPSAANRKYISLQYANDGLTSGRLDELSPSLRIGRYNPCVYRAHKRSDDTTNVHTVSGIYEPGDVLVSGNPSPSPGGVPFCHPLFGVRARNVRRASPRTVVSSFRRSGARHLAARVHSSFGRPATVRFYQIHDHKRYICPLFASKTLT